MYILALETLNLEGNYILFIVSLFTLILFTF